jgi:hypothetical protein
MGSWVDYLEFFVQFAEEIITPHHGWQKLFSGTYRRSVSAS